MDTQLRATTATWSGPPARARSRPRPTPTIYRERLGVYAVQGLLGEGGMARVYRALHTGIERMVAIKRLLPELAGVPEAHALFLREARIAGSIRHPNLVEIFDFGYDAEGRPYFVMELAPGETLGQRLEHGPLPPDEALDVAIAIADAVAVVHRAGYVHRDIKSDNVVLGCDDRQLIPKLIDFGIACRIDAPAAEHPEDIAGTPRVMAPEQVSRDPVDQRTDIWGLGVLLYEMVTARLPFAKGATLRDDMIAIVTEPPRPLPADLHPEIAAIIATCLSKDPDGRPADASVLATGLRSVRASYRQFIGLAA